MNPNLLSTKFIFAILVILMGFVLVLMSKVEANDFFKFAELIGGSYIVGNVAEKFSPLLKDK